MTPADEGERFYCPSCAGSQNYGVVTLAIFGGAGIAGAFSPIFTGIIMLAWLLGSCGWFLHRFGWAIHRRVVGTHLDRTKL